MGTEGTSAQPAKLKLKIASLGPARQYIANALKRGKLLHLHAGCGATLLAGWLNFDRMDFIGPDGGRTTPGHAHAIGGRCYVQHDANRRYPVGDGCISSVYSEHFIEHLSVREGALWLRELRRVMKPGAPIRLSTPDLAQYVRGYLDESGIL